MSEEIIFFDLPAKDGRAWSLNPWKTRLLLNFKGLPYRTRWTEYPDVEPTLKPLVPPNGPDGFALYTIPAATFPTGNSLMDSLTIAKHIESQYPSPPVHLDDPRVGKIANEMIPKIMGVLRSIYIPAVPAQLLNPPSAEYFRRTREARFKTTIEALRDDPEHGGAKAWEAARPLVQALAALYREDTSGPFLRGKEVGYADFVVVGWLKMFERLGDLEKMFETSGGEELRGVWEGCREWLKRDDH